LKAVNALRNLNQAEVVTAAAVALAIALGEAVDIRDVHVLSGPERRNLHGRQLSGCFDASQCNLPLD
jgi:hypothetical protein